MKAMYFGTTTLLFDDGKDLIRPGFNYIKRQLDGFPALPDTDREGLFLCRNHGK